MPETPPHGDSDSSGLLAIDIGNSNIHMGLWKDSSWRLNWRLRTVQQKMPDEYAVYLGNFLRDSGLGWDSIRSVAVASVVPSLTTTFIELAQRYVGQSPLVISPEINTRTQVHVGH